MVEKLKKKCYNVNVLDTVCEVRLKKDRMQLQLSDRDWKICVETKALIHKSFMTSKLKNMKKTFVWTPSDMDYSKLVGKKLVGITAEVPIERSNNYRGLSENVRRFKQLLEGETINSAKWWYYRRNCCRS